MLFEQFNLSESKGIMELLVYFKNFNEYSIRTRIWYHRVLYYNLMLTSGSQILLGTRIT